MLHNDISNFESPRLAFDIDSLIFADYSPSALDKVLSIFRTEFYKYIQRPVLQDNIMLINAVWNKTHYAIYLTTGETFTDSQYHRIMDIFQLIELPYTVIVPSQDAFSIRDKITRGYFAYYFSNNDDMLSVVGKNAYRIDRIWEVL